ncbi:MAG: ZIP family zinc transporter [Zhongshania aliphaticivorans]|jgi:ZIP family zinc transporter|uniref:ZIP family metal transporter n=1 Tax=Zhongshania aliphaticivorans TaxID=1470434 RepID=UPI0039E4EF2D
MQGISEIIVFTVGAGACIPLGGYIARHTHVHQQWLAREFRHAVIALGAGILLGAVAMVLVPEALHHLGYAPWATLLLLGGGLLFYSLERYLDIHRHSAPQFTGMLLDFIPESLALGGLAAAGADSSLLLAVLIGLQNLPEGFNAYQELCDAKYPAKKVLLVMVALVPLGPIFGLSGYYFLGEQPEILGAILLIASGGILYLIFQDIAPQVPLRKHRGPPLAAVVGFALAMLGSMLSH